AGLERGEVGAYGRRAPLQFLGARDRLRSDGLAGLEVAVEDQLENLLLALGEHGPILGMAAERTCRRPQNPPWALSMSLCIIERAHVVRRSRLPPPRCG